MIALVLAVALAQSPEAKVREMLRRPHDAPAWADVRAAAPDAETLMLAIARDAGGGWGVERLRATFMLGDIERADVIDGLERLAKGDALASVRRTALGSLARNAKQHPAVLERAAIAALGDADPHVRLAAVQGLGAASPAGRAALAAAAKRETEKFVKTAIDATLTAPR